MIAVLLLDIVCYTGSIWFAFPTGTMQDVLGELSDPGVPAPARISPPDTGNKAGPHQWYPPLHLSNVYPVRGYLSTTGYASLAPRTPLSSESEEYKLLLGSQAIWMQDSQSWRLVADPLPPVRLMADVVQSSDPARDIHRIDYRRQALVAAPVAVDPGAHGVAQWTQPTTQTAQVVTETSGPMLCVLAQRFHAGWKAQRDGKDVALFPVYGLLTGFLAPPGRHVTEMKFQPADVTEGVWLAAFGILISSLGAVWAGRTRFADPGVEWEDVNATALTL